MLSYADKLRRLAFWLDEHPTIAGEVQGAYTYPTIQVYVYGETDEESFDEFKEIIRTIGDFDKSDSYGGSLTAKHTEWRDPIEKGEKVFSVSVTTSGVCERVEKVDESGKPVMIPKRVYQDSEELEPVYEWKCPDSWLG